MSVTATFLANGASGNITIKEREGIHFTAYQTTATGVTYPFRKLMYKYSFGDSSPTAYTYGNPSLTNSNVEYSPNAYHVYETPGSYTCTLTVYNPANGEVDQTTITVTVQAWTDAQTVLINPNGDSDFSWYSGNSASTISNVSLPAGNLLSDADNYVAQNRRVLVKPGMTFGSSGATFTANGPWYFGVEKGATQAAVSNTSGTVFTVDGPNSESGYGRGVVAGFDITGTTGQDACSMSDGQFNDMLWLDLDISGTPEHGFISSEGNWNSSWEIWKRMAMVRTTITGARKYAAYLAGRSDVILDSSWSWSNATLGGHCIRSKDQSYGLIAHSNLSATASSAGNLIKKWALSWTTAEDVSQNSPSGRPSDINTDNLYSEYICFYDNVFDTSSATMTLHWIVVLTAENESSDERHREIIVERNYWPDVSSSVANGNLQCLRFSQVIGAEARNNVFRNASRLYTTGEDGTIIGIEQYANTANGPCDEINIYNNSLYTAHDTDTPTSGIIHLLNIIESGMGDISNDDWAVDGIGGAVNLSTGDANATLTEAGSAVVSAGFSTNPPTQWSHFTLTESQAGAGTQPLSYDMNGASRYGVTRDIGADQFTTGTDPSFVQGVGVGVSFTYFR